MDVFAAVADKTRRAMLDLIAVRPRRAGELVDAFPNLTQPAVSRHLRVLRETGLVKVTSRAQQRIYGLNAETLAQVYAWVARYQEFWPEHLDALERHLNARAKTTTGRRRRA